MPAADLGQVRDAITEIEKTGTVGYVDFYSVWTETHPKSGGEPVATFQVTNGINGSNVLGMQDFDNFAVFDQWMQLHGELAVAILLVDDTGGHDAPIVRNLSYWFDQYNNAYELGRYTTGGTFVVVASSTGPVTPTLASDYFLRVFAFDSSFTPVDYVPESRTIAGIDLEDDITKVELQTALDMGDLVPKTTKIAGIDLSDDITAKELNHNLMEDIIENNQNLLETGNMIDFDDLLDNKYYDINTGNLLTGNGTTKSTKLIPVEVGRYYYYTNETLPMTSYVFSVCIFDASKNFIRYAPAYDFSVRPRLDIGSGEAYVGITILNARVGKCALMPKAKAMRYYYSIGNTNNVIPPHFVPKREIVANTIVVAKNGKGDAISINNAVELISDDTSNNPYTIFIKNGTYKEVIAIQGGRHISLIGENMKDCIIRDDTGLYENSPLQIAGDFLVENLTIIATYNDNPTMSHTGNKAYAIHIDYSGAGTGIVRNCKLVSYQSSAIGAGLWQDQTLVIENCELTSYTPNAHAWDEDSDWTSTPPYGALFVHSATESNVTNQVLTVKNCYITSANKRACAFSNSPDGTSNMTINLVNNNFWCEDGNADSVVTEWYSPVYSGRSHGNNIAKLNN